jgi:hypothetical protein
MQLYCTPVRDPSILKRSTPFYFLRTSEPHWRVDVTTPLCMVQSTLQGSLPSFGTDDQVLQGENGKRDAKHAHG